MGHDAIVSYALDGPVAVITLDKPPLNLIDLDLIDGLVAALIRARNDDRARAVVVTTALDRAFSAGLDLNRVLDGGSAMMRALLGKLYVGLYDAQHELGQPSSAALRGLARGGGMTIALSSNVVVAAEDASFGYPELDVGILPGLHFTHLPRIVGRHKAFELLFTGRTFDAAEAVRLGLINRVASAGELLAQAMDMALAFARKPPGAVATARDHFMRINDRDYRSEIAGVIDDMARMIDGEETQAALRRFLDGGRAARE
jgi:enoyl-CoA hydratase/carnithine racemase